MWPHQEEQSPIGIDILEDGSRKGKDIKPNDPRITQQNVNV